MLLSRVVPGLIRQAHLCNVHSMSLNRAEQILFDYMENHAEERHFWREKVLDVMEKNGNDFAVSATLAIELGLYCEERRHAGSVVTEVVTDKYVKHFSFRNLAEHLMRIWGPVRPPRQPDQSTDDEISL